MLARDPLGELGDPGFRLGGNFFRSGGVPFPLAPSAAGLWRVDEAAGAVTVSAQPHTDIFIDPGNGSAGAGAAVNAESLLNAATLLGDAPEGDFQEGARRVPGQEGHGVGELVPGAAEDAVRAGDLGDEVRGGGGVSHACVHGCPPGSWMDGPGPG